MYNNYDTVKIKTSNKYLLKPISYNCIETNPINGEITSKRFISKKILPFNLFIDEHNATKKLTIEFSSKILLDNYPSGININTIEQSLENINSLGVCKLDVKGIIDNGYFTDLDVFMDLANELTEEQLTALNTNVSDYRRYKWKHYQKQGIAFYANVKDPRCKDYLKFYNKGLELQSGANNKKFLKMLNDPDRVIQQCNGKTRVEFSMKTPDLITKFHDTPDSKILTVLNSKSNPILTQFDRIFDLNRPIISKELTTYEDKAMMYYIEHFGSNMKLIEQDLRSCYNTADGKRKRMKKIESIMDIMKHHEDNNPVKEIRMLIEKFA